MFDRVLNTPQNGIALFKLTLSQCKRLLTCMLVIVVFVIIGVVLCRRSSDITWFCPGFG